MLIGYARVSSRGQSLERQISALNAASVDKIFREKVSGKSVKGRPQLDRAIDALGAGDVFVIAEWDRATRSMIDGINIIQRIAECGAIGESCRAIAWDLGVAHTTISRLR
ncbi:recombinase family protein (plasmid) [Aliiroseovarius crassostreae]|uniref:Recombinase family protein n=1 Tax=Aliiroseovarius crassostreae TaxID=154981 RepID=A0A9Q9HBH5_9RHOB|nr:recombinase family protein [Aliiroseovarius crassostreae]UWP97043.1 recombinase family protein [Aliiroseovarius crassostreae]